MKKFTTLQCLCLHCGWVWEVVSTKFDIINEQCLRCGNIGVLNGKKRVCRILFK